MYIYIHVYTYVCVRYIYIYIYIYTYAQAYQADSFCHVRCEHALALAVDQLHLARAARAPLAEHQHGTRPSARGVAVGILSTY